MTETSQNLFDLTGRTALVTGGGYGLGRALVRGMADHGATVLGISRSPDALAETFSNLSGEHRYLVGDLTDESIYEQLETAPEEIDILVNNAGGDPHTKPWPKQSSSDWRNTYEINVIAAERLARLLTPSMADRGWGRVINIASIYGSVGQDPRNTTLDAGAGAYTAAKHALNGFTRYLACQLGATGVTVNSLSPGMITWHPDPSDEVKKLWERLATQTPVGRNSQPEDYVTAVVFLSSDGSGFVNGHDLVVDGGWSAW